MNLFDAVLARLRENPALAGIVFDGDADADDGVRPAPYVVVYGGPGDHTDPTLDTRITFNQSAADFEYTIQGINSSQRSALALGVEIAVQLLNWRPVVDGLTCWPMRQVETNQIERDKTLTPNQWYTDDTYAVRTTPR